MSGQSARRVRELEKQLAERDHELALANASITELSNEVNMERLGRVSAQRGLVAYMQTHGLGHRIGYDPDKDQAVLAEVTAGRIPPLESVPNDQKGE